MIPIFFFSESIELPFSDFSLYRENLLKMIIAENFSLKSLTYIFCTDEYLLSINQKYLSHHYFTDVITFNNSDLSTLIDGDIFISIFRVKENAFHFSAPFEAELHRVMIHGLLHLMGYDDSTTSQKNIMTNMENLYLPFLVSQ